MNLMEQLRQRREAHRQAQVSQRVRQAEMWRMLAHRQRKRFAEWLYPDDEAKREAYMRRELAPSVEDVRAAHGRDAK